MGDSLNTKHHFKFVIIALVSVFLFACQQTAETTQISTATLVSSPSLTPTRKSSSTSIPSTKTNTSTATNPPTFTSMPPTETPTVEPTPTLTPSSIPTATQTPESQGLLLKQFPLEVGLTRIYQVTFTYAVKPIPETMSWETGSWTGLVTEKITERLDDENGTIFIAKLQNYPSYFDGNEVILETISIKYELMPDGLKRGGIKILQFPVEIGAKWLAFDDDFAETDSDLYKWIVDDVVDVIIPAGQYSDCFSMFLQTGPDYSNASFCPGIGIVKRSSFHHGEPRDYYWELTSMEKS